MKRILVAAITAALLSGVASATAAASASPVPSAGHRVDNDVSTLCGSGQWKWVDQGRYVLDNEVFGSGTSECLYNSRDENNFTITKFSGPFSWDAYPSLFTGCWYGICSQNTPLPAKISSLSSASETLGTKYKATGGNDADDFWFNKSGTTKAHPNGDELMIWINERDFTLGTGTYVHLDGKLWHWHEASERDGSVIWHYSQFIEMKRPGVMNHSQYLTRLNIMSFIHLLEKHHYLYSGWTWQAAPAGYEVTRHPQGTQTRWYDLDVTLKG